MDATALVLAGVALHLAGARIIDSADRGFRVQMGWFSLGLAWLGMGLVFFVVGVLAGLGVIG